MKTIEEKVASAAAETIRELRAEVARLREGSGTSLARVVDLAENLSDRDLEDLAGKVREISRSRPGMS